MAQVTAAGWLRRTARGGATSPRPAGDDQRRMAVKIKRRDDVAPAASGYAGVTKQVVLGPADGSDEIVLRYFSVAPGEATPWHAHDFPHLVKVEAGQGVAVSPDGAANPVEAGHYVYVAPNELHNFKNTGTEPFEFVCIVPGRGEPPAAT